MVLYVHDKSDRSEHLCFVVVQVVFSKQASQSSSGDVRDNPAHAFHAFKVHGLFLSARILGINLNRSGTDTMLIVYICLIVLSFGIIDAFIFKSIRAWESSRLKNIQEKEDQLTITYNDMVKETQKLKAAAETMKIESSSAPEPPKSREEKKVSAPSQTNITMQLLQKALITRDQLKKAKQYQKSMGTGKSIEEILVLLGSLSQESLDEFMQSQ